MPTPPMSDELLIETAKAYARAGGNAQRMARELGIPGGTVGRRLQRARERGFIGASEIKVNTAVPNESELELPPLPADDISPQEIIDQAKTAFNKRAEYKAAAKWFDVKVKTNRPIGVAFIGDPHLDDNGTNWPLFEKHVQILEKTDGLYAIGGNDVTNNWVGRLLRLHADQDMSKKRAWRLARWLLAESDVKWLLHVLGNHDAWNEGAELYRMFAALGKQKTNVPVVPVFDWEAKFKLSFPNGRECKVWMTHDFPGHSQWNHLHGAQKAALMKEDAHIYACAHRHCWAIHQEEHAYRDFVYWLIRSRGYKFEDKYARDHGYGSQKHGATVVAVLDPLSDSESSMVRCFSDVSEGAEFLEWKRSRT